MIQVSISSKPTFEDPSITDTAERERLFWQADHVRLYGFDILERLTGAGFEVETVFGDQLVASDQLSFFAASGRRERSTLPCRLMDEVRVVGYCVGAATRHHLPPRRRED